ncbi:MAG TPA: iron ABC transporter permease [Dongiaceae bacterium]|nr:iron ABC transporter permease [Dongiaceae bacterium]
MTFQAAGQRPALARFFTVLRPAPSPVLLAAALLPVLLVLVPLGVTIVKAFKLGAEEAAHLLFRPLVGELLLHTLAIAATAAAASALIGTAAAWFVERTRLPGQRLWAVLVAVPLAVPAFITSYAWVSLSASLQDFAGALLVVTSAYYPLVYLPVAAALRGMDPAVEETARSLGCSPAASFFRVVLPQLRPALLGGMLLVTLDVLAEFGAFSLLRFRTFTTQIYAEYRTGFNGAGASLLSAVLIFLCLICLLAELKVRGGARYGRLGRGTRRAVIRHELGRAKLPVLAGFLLLIALTLGLPLGMILYWLTQHGSAASTPVAPAPLLLLAATANSLGLGLAGAALTTVIALPLGFLATRYSGPLVTFLERAAYLAQGVPGIVIALAIVSLTVHALRPLYQTTGLLLLAYAILFLPLALVSVRSALVQAQPSLEDAGRALGLGRLAVIHRVVLPLAAPGLGAAGAMVFISVVTELTTTLLLAPIGTRTLATQVWADTSTLAFAAAAPFAGLLVLISLASSWLLASFFGRSGLLGTTPSGRL